MERKRPRHGDNLRNRRVSRKTNLPSRSHRPSFPRPLPSRCGVPHFAAPAAYGFPRRRGFQHFDGRRVPRLTRSLSECWKPRQVSSRFRQVECFSALSMAGGFLARPAGCWKGGKAAPESPFPQRPRAFTPPAGQFQKSQRKRAPSRMPFTRLSNPRNIRQPMPDIQRLRPQTRDSRSHLLRRP